MTPNATNHSTTTLLLFVIVACVADGDGSAASDDGSSTGIATSSTTADPTTTSDSTGPSEETAAADGGDTSATTGGPGIDCGAEPDSAWAPGDDVGQLDGDMWLPGRADDGRVTCASWQTVPIGRWVQVVGTRLDTLDASVKAAVPGWSDRGNEDWNGVLADWVGMAWDIRHGSERGWVTVGGGHDGSSNDGVYRLDVRNMMWAIERMPSDSSAWPESYNASFTNFTPAVAYYDADPTNLEGVYGDELFDPTNRAISTRTPTARHTYGSTVFVPELGDAGKILMGCRRYWEYDVATSSWSLPKFPFDAAAGYSGATGYTGENMHGWWNETEGRYYVSATQNYGESQTWSVVAGGSDWRWEGGYPIGGWATVYTAQDQRGQTLHTLLYESGRPATLRITDLDTREQTDHAIAFGDTLAGLTFDEMAYWDGGTLAHVAETGTYLANMYTVEEGMVWVWLDDATWTLERAALEGSYPTNVNINTETKLEYFPDAHVLIWVNTADEDIRIIRLG